MPENQKTDLLLYTMEITILHLCFKILCSDCMNFKGDIVGFTQLARTRMPNQVVDFLNKMYSTFDEVIDQYYVYKMEMIRDACEWLWMNG
eukprot:bmy_19063T0